VRVDDGRLVIMRGLLERRARRDLRRSLQALRLHANPIRRVLGLASLSAVVAGYAGKNEETKESRWCFPSHAIRTALRVARVVLGASAELASIPLEGPPRHALARPLIDAAVAGVVLGAGGLGVAGNRGALALLVALPLGVGGWLRWRGNGHALAGEHVLVRSGALSRRMYLVPIANVQHLELRSSPLQRALDISTLRLRIPRAAPRIADLGGHRARDRFGVLSASLSGAARPSWRRDSCGG
jgi:putative membrane protein